jgi:hypothetical protein
MSQIVLSNPSRLWVPVISLGLVGLMFGPAMALSPSLNADPVRFGLGLSVMLISMLWLALSAWRAPFRASISSDEIRVDRLMRSRSCGPVDVVWWQFAVPEGAPTRTAPSTNALLMLRLADGTRFRAEVTAEQAAAVADILGRQA